MISIKLIFAVAIFTVDLEEILGHGKLLKPVSRSSKWRDSRFNSSEPNHEDNELYCGGIGELQRNGHKCGACGDIYTQRIPRDNENGGRYGNGVIVETYRRGQRIQAVVSLDTNHMGYFKFALCPLSKRRPVETEECFKRYPIKAADGSRLFVVQGHHLNNVTIDLKLPEGFNCAHCSFRWHYRCANSWGKCRTDGVERKGCGDAHEIFRGCADIRIL